MAESALRLLEEVACEAPAGYCHLRNSGQYIQQEQRGPKVQVIQWALQLLDEVRQKGLQSNAITSALGSAHTDRL